MENTGADRPRIGVSACLLGDEVRFDGGHKRDPFLADILGPHVEWVRVCPEVEVGMGTPRETLRLVRTPEGGIRMMTTRTGVDHTDAMQQWADSRLRQLEGDNLSGYILKKASPSCGLERVKVFGGTAPERNGRGLFAAALLGRFPSLPVEEEGRLSDPRLRENFIERVFAYQRLQQFFTRDGSVGGLVTFHTAHKMALLAHSTTEYRRLGGLVATAAAVPPEEWRARYQSAFMATLARLATPARHANVLMHMAGHLKKLLDPVSKAELLSCIDEYRRGLIPLVVPITLIRHFVRRHGVAYLAGQTYLEPHPRELMLRNRV